MSNQSELLALADTISELRAYGRDVFRVPLEPHQPDKPNTAQSFLVINEERRDLIVSALRAASAPAGDAVAWQALDRAADGELFTYEELEAVAQIYRDVVAYIEKVTDYQVGGAVAAGIEYTVREKAIPLLTRRPKELLAVCARPPAPAVEVREALEAIDAQIHEMRSLKGWRLNLIRENLTKLRTALSASPREMGLKSDGGVEGTATTTDDQIKHMVNRFLSWKLPRDTFNPDCGISFDKKPFNAHTAHPMLYEPSGTNLFGADQAEAMVRHMLEGLPGPPEPSPSSETVQNAAPRCIWCHDAPREPGLECPRCAEARQDADERMDNGRNTGGKSYRQPSPSSRSETAWQLIETAPHEQRVLLGWWSDGCWVVDAGFASHGWRTPAISNISHHGQATHWQPLPLPGGDA